MFSTNGLRTINRCLEFASKSDFRNLERYFQIPESSLNDQVETTLSIWMEPTDIIGQYYIVIHTRTAHRAERGGVPLLVFPEDIERLIYGYFNDSNEIRIKMTLPQHFPIRAPNFKLVSSTRQSTEIHSIVGRMNCDLNVDYSPALAIEKTFLILLSRLLEVINYAV